jgi:hypothetical protein
MKEAAAGYLNANGLKDLAGSGESATPAGDVLDHGWMPRRVEEIEVNNSP